MNLIMQKRDALDEIRKCLADDQLIEAIRCRKNSSETITIEEFLSCDVENAYDVDDLLDVVKHHASELSGLASEIENHLESRKIRSELSTIVQCFHRLYNESGLSPEEIIEKLTGVLTNGHSKL